LLMRKHLVARGPVVKPRPITHSSKVRISCRVPVTRTLRLTWRLPMKVLVQSAAKELWESSEYVHLCGPVSTASLSSVLWPQRLTRLTFGNNLNLPILGILWPASLQHLSFGWAFNQPIVGVTWPASLQQLSFGGDYSQPFVGSAQPTNSNPQCIISKFNQPIFGVVCRTLCSS